MSENNKDNQRYGGMSRKLCSYLVRVRKSLESISLLLQMKWRDIIFAGVLQQNFQISEEKTFSWILLQLGSAASNHNKFFNTNSVSNNHNGQTRNAFAIKMK